jgi:hypothetical protein
MTYIWTAIPKNFRLRLKFFSPRIKYTNRTGQDLKLIHVRAQESPVIHGHGRHHPSPFPLSPPVARSHNKPSDLTTKISNVSLLPLGAMCHRISVVSS